MFRTDVTRACFSMPLAVATMVREITCGRRVVMEADFLAAELYFAGPM